MVNFVLGVGSYGQASDVPQGAVAVDDATFAGLMNGSLTWNGAAAIPTVVVAQTLAQAQAIRTQLMIDTAQSQLAAILAGYPSGETLTWDSQFLEATAYTAAPSTAKTPTLSAMASTSGLTVAALSTKVIAKAAAYQSASGAIIGRRQMLCTQIAAATTIAQVQGIVW